MSRRYGRNQKRAARARIADLEEAYMLNEGLRQRQARQLEQARNELADVAMALGENFIGLQPGEIAWKAERKSDLMAWRHPVPGGSVTMHSLCMECLDHSDHPAHQMHLRVRLADGLAAYALSEAAILRTPAEFLALNISRELAHLLVRVLRERGAR